MVPHSNVAGEEPAPYHALDAAQAVAAAASNATAGLLPEEARRRLERFGANALNEPRRRSLLSVILGQFKSPLIYLLFVAAGVALALGHTQDAIVILAVVLLNSIIGALQEGRAERSLEALRKLATHKARLIRGGEELIVEAREVVPGDLPGEGGRDRATEHQLSAQIGGLRGAADCQERGRPAA